MSFIFLYRPYSVLEGRSKQGKIIYDGRTTTHCYFHTSTPLKMIRE